MHWAVIMRLLGGVRVNATDCDSRLRFVQRLPPVLGYDVDTNLRPKWDFLVNTLRLTTFDVSRFPAYFSYPLEKVTMPRMAYLAAVNQPNAVWGLNLILTPSDDIFATKVTIASVCFRN